MEKFLDIFEKKPKRPKKKTEEKPKVLVDYREKNSLVASELAAMGLETEFIHLKVADYIINDVAIERKTVQDFVSSMISKRIIRQLQELSQYENKFLIIEGLEEQELYNDENGRINGNAVRGFLLSIILKYKVPIIFSKDYKDTARYLFLLAKKKTKEPSLNAKKKALNKQEQLQFIIEGFPGVGPKTAKKLLTKFETIKGIINASKEELQELLGKKAETIFEIIHRRYKSNYPKG